MNNHECSICRDELNEKVLLKFILLNVLLLLFSFSTGAAIKQSEAVDGIFKAAFIGLNLIISSAVDDHPPSISMLIVLGLGSQPSAPLLTISRISTLELSMFLIIPLSKPR